VQSLVAGAKRQPGDALQESGKQSDTDDVDELSSDFNVAKVNDLADADCECIVLCAVPARR
jgi:hypothetical protein